jgi:hypothetical protein
MCTDCVWIVEGCIVGDVVKRLDGCKVCVMFLLDVIDAMKRQHPVILIDALRAILGVLRFVLIVVILLFFSRWWSLISDITGSSCRKR